MLQQTTSWLPLEWRHNGRDGAWNHQPHDCSLNRLFKRRSKKTSKLRVTGRWQVNSPHKAPVTRNFFFHLMTSPCTRRTCLCLSKRKDSACRCRHDFENKYKMSRYLLPPEVSSFSLRTSTFEKNLARNVRYYSDALILQQYASLFVSVEMKNTAVSL